MSRKNLSLAAAVIAIIVISLLSYRHISIYLDEKAADQARIETIQKYISEQSVASGRVFALETEDTSLTFAKLFERTSEISTNIDKVIDKALNEPALSEDKKLIMYLKLLQDSVALSEAKYRKTLEFSNAVDVLTDSTNALSAADMSNEYSIKYALERAKSARDEAQEAKDQKAEAESAYLQKLKSLSKFLDGYTNPPDGIKIVDNNILKKTIAKIEPAD